MYCISDFVISAKEIMFLETFVCLFVCVYICLFATLLKNIILWRGPGEGGVAKKEQVIRLW